MLANLPHKVEVELAGLAETLALHDTGDHAVTDGTEVGDGREVIEDDSGRHQAPVYHATELQMIVRYLFSLENIQWEVLRRTYASTTKVSHTNGLLRVRIALHHKRLDVLGRVENAATPVELAQLLHKRMARVEDNAVPFAALHQGLGSDGVQLLEEEFDILGLERLLRLGQGDELSGRGEPAGRHRKNRVRDRHFECGGWLRISF